MTMDKNTRFGALVLTFALVASACGGDSSVEADQAEQLAELQAQIEELESQADAPAETTTTTAAPAETETDTDSAPVTASGDRFNASIDPNAAAAFLGSLVGPTDDLSGLIQTFDFAFPAVTTLPDTEIVSVRTDVEQFSAGDPYTQRTQVQMLTSAAPEDAVLAYQTELAALFPDERVSTSNRDDDGDITFFASVGFTYDIAATEVSSGDTIVRLTANSTGRVVSEEQLAAFDGLAAASPLNAEPDATLGEIVLDISSNIPSVEVQHRFENLDEDQFAARVPGLTENSGWTLDRQTDSLSYYVAPSLEDEVLITWNATESDDGVFTTRARVSFDFPSVS